MLPVLKRIIKGIIIFLLLLAAIYFLGPRPNNQPLDTSLPSISKNGKDLADWIDSLERNVPNIKEDNQARIVWNSDSSFEKTEYSVVYLHGFSASQGEGFPIHEKFAKRYGCNLYLPRLFGHGISDGDAMKNMTSLNLLASAKEAIAIGKQIGDKVILLSTSTGGTLSLYLADDPGIYSLILYSPNISIKEHGAKLLSGPWGHNLAKFAARGEYVQYKSDSSMDSLYWSKKYHINGLMALQVLIDETMSNETFNKVTKPVFLGYYYKNEEEQDHTVSIQAMLEMYSQLSTPDSLKWNIAFANVGRHVIGSKYKSKDYKSVQDSTFKFAEEILGLTVKEYDKLTKR